MTYKREELEPIGFRETKDLCSKHRKLPVICYRTCVKPLLEVGNYTLVIPVAQIFQRGGG